VKPLAVIKDGDKDAIPASRTPLRGLPVNRNSLHLTVIVESRSIRVHEIDFNYT
jgi:hypothetical protein